MIRDGAHPASLNTGMISPKVQHRSMQANTRAPQSYAGAVPAVLAKLGRGGAGQRADQAWEGAGTAAEAATKSYLPSQVAEPNTVFLGSALAKQLVQIQVDPSESSWGVQPVSSYLRI